MFHFNVDLYSPKANGKHYMELGLGFISYVVTVSYIFHAGVALFIHFLLNWR